MTSNAVRRGIGIVFQAFNLFPHMSVLDNVTLGPRKALGESTAEAEARATSSSPLRSRRQGRRVPGPALRRPAAARGDRACAGDAAQLLLLDEVTSALDPELVGEVLDVIRELATGGMTMVIATHEMAFAREIAGQVCFLDEGVILEQGPPEQIFSSPPQPRTQQFLDRIIRAGRL